MTHDRRHGKRNEEPGWDQERESDREYERGHESAGEESWEREREYYPERHHEDHRGVQREREHHSVHDTGRHRPHSEPTEGERRRASRVDVEHMPPHLEREIEHHSKEGEHHSPNTHGELGPRRSRQVSHERNVPVRDIHEIREEPPLPPTPSRLPPTPVPLDFPVEGKHGEYGPHEVGEEDPRLRAELYPLEENLHRDKRPPRHKHDDPEHPREGSSHINVISAETFGHSPHRHSIHDPHDGSLSHHAKHGVHHDLSGSRRLSSRSSPYVHREGHSPEVLPESLHRAESLRRRSMAGSDNRRSSQRVPRSYSILKEEEETPMPRNASVLLPVLEDTERIFHEIVASGDVQATRSFLLDHPNFNINCVNYQKISALHVAVKDQNEAMVEFLLEQRGIDISDCALYAIKGGNLRIVEMIFETINQRSPGLEFVGPAHSVDFSDDLTPLILAAQVGNYEIIDYLIKRGHTIPPVHPPYCKCDVCRAELKKYDRLRYSTMKLNLYKAICNPMYMFHVTDDPFQRSFELTKELQDAAMVFPQFKVLFQELWMSLRHFTVDLIGCCRNAQEVEIVLKKSPSHHSDHVRFPRLQYAIDLKQKEFVSHPYTQAVLADAWTGDLLEWKVRSPVMQSLAVFPRIPMLPIMTIMCMFLPNHSLVRKWKTPVNRMISSAASYVIFLVVLFLESNLDKTNQKRGPPNSGYESVIIVYVVGYIWLNIRTCFKQGVKRFFSTMWHWYDTIMLCLFAATIICWIASLVDITANNDVDLPRKYWNSYDPELIAEGVFAAAVIMAFFRLNLFLALNYHLGPVQVSIGKMTLDIFRFVIIFTIIIFAWCAGLCRFYQPYDGMVQKDAASGSTTTQVSSFVSFATTMKTFFWAIFGLSPIESADVIIENLPGDTPGTTIINQHRFTESVGYTAFALYQFLSVVVVLNMLVACMANTFTKVTDNVPVEWVFGRSQIYLSFMASSVLPPPFNLVPTASGIRDMFKWFSLLAKPSDGQRAKCSLAHCCYIESETEAYVNHEFPSLMSELAQRYIRFVSQREEEETNHDLEEIKNEVNELKEMVRKLHPSNLHRRSSGF